MVDNPSGRLGYYENVRNLALRQAISYAGVSPVPHDARQILKNADIFEAYLKKGLDNGLRKLESEEAK